MLETPSRDMQADAKPALLTRWQPLPQEAAVKAGSIPPEVATGAASHYQENLGVRLHNDSSAP